MTTLPIPTATELLEQLTVEQLEHTLACRRARERVAAARRRLVETAPDADPETVAAFERRDFDGRVSVSWDIYREQAIDEDIAASVIVAALVNDEGFDDDQAWALVSQLTGRIRRTSDDRWAAVTVAMVTEDRIDARSAVEAVLGLADEGGADLRAVGATTRRALKRALA